MYYKLFLLLISFFSVNLQAQTFIASSNYSGATEGNNQRKIVRDSMDNVYIVFVDSVNHKKLIKGVIFDSSDLEWSESFVIIDGDSPTLAIEKNNSFHLVYCSGDSLPKIKYISSNDFINWSSEILVSVPAFANRSPVSDVDLSSNLTILWVQKNSQSESLMVSRFNKQDLLFSNNLITKNEINDIAIANHLQYGNDQLFFAIQYNLDSMQFYKVPDNGSVFDLVYESPGIMPCITFSSSSPYGNEVNNARFLYLDTLGTLQEREINYYFENESSIHAGISIPNVSYVCVDNVVPDLGYSFLYLQNEDLYHAFSYVATYYKMSTIPGPVLNPSIAYKHFNFEYVDFIWTEENNGAYRIFHKRDNKHKWVSTENLSENESIDFTGYPNPFFDKIHINVKLADPDKTPVIKIFNTGSQVIKTLKSVANHGNEYSFVWNGSTDMNLPAKNGTYVLLCISGNKRMARKVIFNGN